jgi:hypothetical protein
MKTAGYIILGVAAIGGVLWYVKSKNDKATADSNAQAAAPVSVVNQALPTPPKTVVDPAALVKPLVLNPGIVPPLASKTAVVPAVTKPALTLAQQAVIKKTLIQSGTKVPVMMGLGSAFLMN